MDNRDKRANPDEVAQYIRFALSELGEKNAHHEFEHLCRWLTRKRICPNIIPSTGPVSAGGDKGIDFQSYPVLTSETGQEPSDFFAMATESRTYFACSLRKDCEAKIRQDVATVCSQGKKADLTFFSNQAIPKAKQEDIISRIRDEFGVLLGIFDCHAISELLADREVFWIAQRFLSIPSEFVLQESGRSPKWYKAALAAQIDEGDLTAASFFEIKDALRFAAYNSEYNSDVPALIHKLRIFRTHSFPSIRRKAIYEEFVTSLRAFGIVESYDADLRDYFKDVGTLRDVADLEDASCLLDFVYANAAKSQSGFSIDLLKDWGKELSEQIDRLLSESISVGRRCALLEVKGHLMISLWPHVDREIGNVYSRERWMESASRGITIWREMIRDVGDVPLFPLERLSNRLSYFVVFLGDVDGFHELVQETDDLLRARFGNYKVAEKAMQRAVNLHDAGRLLDAIDELHRARIGFFGREKVRGTLLASLQISQWYEQNGLFFAAKYFALGGAFAALNIDNDDIKDLVPRALDLVTSCDYAAGGSLLLFVSTYAYLYASQELGQPRTEAPSPGEAEAPIFHAILTTYAASLLEPNLGEFLKERFLKNWDLDDVYVELLPVMQKSYGAAGRFDEFAKKASEEKISSPFCDVGGVRTAAWQQLKIDWVVRWPMDYATNIAGEAFVALLQILLCDLRKTELSILPTEVQVTLRLGDDKLKIDQLPDNTKLRLEVCLPRDCGTHSANSQRRKRRPMFKQSQ